MKNFLKKVISSVAAVSMAVTIMGGVGSSIPAYAADDTKEITYTAGTDQPAAADGEITIENAQKGETYSLYRVFAATVSDSGDIAYQASSIPEGLTNFFTLNNGNVSATDAAKDTTSEGATAEQPLATPALISALKTWSVNQTALATGSIATTEDYTKLSFKNLPLGYYFIKTTTGAVVTINSTKKTATVKDKNEFPTVDKTITKVADAEDTGSDSTRGSIDTHNDDDLLRDRRAIAEAGSTVTFNGTVTTKSGGTNYVYHDTMSSNLEFGGTVTVTVNGSSVQAGTGTDKKWELLTTNLTPSTDTFQVKFEDSYIQSLDANTEITISYTAVVNDDGLQNESPATNTAKVTYGENGTTSEVQTKVYNAKITVTKTFAGLGTDANYPIAGFVLRKGAGTSDDPYKYYKLTTTNGKDSVTWVTLGSDGTGKVDDDTLKSAIDAEKITQHLTTATSNELVFTGLANGNYTLVESTVPAGYNKATDTAVTIKTADAASDANNFKEDLELTESVENTKGSLLPSTGGIGTTIFYVIGGVLIAGAAILLITRKSSNKTA